MIGRAAILLLGLMVGLTGCASWQKCERETIPAWAQNQNGTGPGPVLVSNLILGICAAVAETK